MVHSEAIQVPQPITGFNMYLSNCECLCDHSYGLRKKYKIIPGELIILSPTQNNDIINDFIKISIA